MDDEKVGYGRPPKSSRFKPGQSGNPHGRPKRALTPLAERITNIMESPMTYREKGKLKAVAARELGLMMLVDRAAKGDIRAAEDILRVRRHAERQAGKAARTLRVENWIPDHPEQTAEQKAKALQDARHAEPTRQIATSRK